jgi:DNA-binding PadR family transcriptional regulator
MGGLEKGPSYPSRIAREQGMDRSAYARVLKRLERMGHVSGRWDREGHRGPPRRVYELTTLGREALASNDAEADHTAPGNGRRTPG